MFPEYKIHIRVLFMQRNIENFISIHFGDKTAGVLRPTDIYGSISLY